MRRHVAAAAILALVGIGGFGLGARAGQANERDETIMTVQVNSADHEIIEGYFSLGDSATLMTKPGTDLHQFLSRQRGKKVRITMTEAGGPELSRLQR